MPDNFESYVAYTGDSGPAIWHHAFSLQAGIVTTACNTSFPLEEAIFSEELPSKLRECKLCVHETTDKSDMASTAKMIFIGLMIFWIGITLLMCVLPSIK